MATFVNPARNSSLQAPSGRMRSVIWIIGLALFTVGSRLVF
jgi:hypothetical protein